MIEPYLATTTLLKLSSLLRILKNVIVVFIVKAEKLSTSFSARVEFILKTRRAIEAKLKEACQETDENQSVKSSRPSHWKEPSIINNQEYHDARSVSTQKKGKTGIEDLKNILYEKISENKGIHIDHLKKVNNHLFSQIV